MKIYFAASIRGGRDNVQLYLRIIDFLKNYGEVLTDYIGNEELTEDGEDKSDEHIHDRDMNWLNEADILIADVSTPSLGVGYEIGRIIERDEEIICLYKKDSNNKLSGMVRGSPNIKVIDYENFDELREKLKPIIRK